MSDRLIENLDPMDFDYSPEKPLSADQRIELLELEVSDLRHQLGVLTEQFGGLVTNRGN